jgi:hypothetical protein
MEDILSVQDLCSSPLEGPGQHLPKVLLSIPFNYLPWAPLQRWLNCREFKELIYFLSNLADYVIEDPQYVGYAVSNWWVQNKYT